MSSRSSGRWRTRWTAVCVELLLDIIVGRLGAGRKGRSKVAIAMKGPREAV